MRKILYYSILALSLLFPCHADAVVEFITTINKTGADYSTLGSWEAATDNMGSLTDGTTVCGDYTCSAGTCDSTNITDWENVTWDSGSSAGNLVHITSTQYAIDVYSGSLANGDTPTDGEGNTFTIDGAPDSCQFWLEGYDDDNAAEDSAVDIGGCTTDSDNYRGIRSASGERHSGILPDGTSGNGFVLKSSQANWETIKTSENYVHVEDMAIDCSAMSGTSYYCLFDNGGTNHVFRNLVIAGSPAHNIYTTGNVSGTVLENVLSYEATIDGFYGQAGSSISNCTSVDNGDDGFDVNSPTMKNNIGCDNGGTDFTWGGGASSTHNLSCDGSAFAINTYWRNKDITFANQANDDYHLTITESDAINMGTDMSGSYTDDIDGDTRSDTFDLGADEFTGTYDCSACETASGFWIDSSICYPELIEYEYADGTECTSTNSCTLSSFPIIGDSGDNRLVVVSVTTEGESNVNTCTLDGDNATGEIHEIDFNSNGTISYQYWLDADLPATAGSYDVVCTTADSESNINVIAISLRRADQAANDDLDSDDCTSCSDITAESTPLVADSIIIDAVHSGGNPTWQTDGSGQVEVYETDNSSSGSAMSYKYQDDSAFTMDWNPNETANRLGIIACAWAPESYTAGCGGGAIIPRVMTCQ